MISLDICYSRFLFYTVLYLSLLQGFLSSEIRIKKAETSPKEKFSKRLYYIENNDREVNIFHLLETIYLIIYLAEKSN